MSEDLEREATPAGGASSEIIVTRLSRWAGDWSVSNNYALPHYANPGEVRRDVRTVVALLRAAERDLQTFGRHLPPCPRWITSGETVDGEEQPCYCGYDEALAAFTTGHRGAVASEVLP